MYPKQYVSYHESIHSIFFFYQTPVRTAEDSLTKENGFPALMVPISVLVSVRAWSSLHGEGPTNSGSVVLLCLNA